MLSYQQPSHVCEKESTLWIMRIRICVAKFMMHSMITNLKKIHIHKFSNNLYILNEKENNSKYLPNRKCNFETQLNLQWLKLDAFYSLLCMIDGPTGDEHQLLYQYHQILHTRKLKRENSIVFKCQFMSHFPTIFLPSIELTQKECVQFKLQRKNHI